MPKVAKSAAEIQSDWRRDPAVEGAARPNQDMIHVLVDGDAGETAGEGLLVDMGVGEFAVAQPCAIGSEHFPATGIVVPSAVGVTHGDGDRPAARARNRGGGEDLRRVSRGGRGEGGAEGECDAEHLFAMPSPARSGDHFGVPAISSRREIEANSRRQSTASVTVVAAASAIGPSIQASAASAK